MSVNLFDNLRPTITVYETVALPLSYSGDCLVNSAKNNQFRPIPPHLLHIKNWPTGAFIALNQIGELTGRAAGFRS